MAFVGVAAIFASSAPAYADKDLPLAAARRLRVSATVWAPGSHAHSRAASDGVAVGGGLASHGHPVAPVISTRRRDASPLSVR